MVPPLPLALSPVSTKVAFSELAGAYTPHVVESPSGPGRSKKRRERVCVGRGRGTSMEMYATRLASLI